MKNITLVSFFLIAIVACKPFDSRLLVSQKETFSPKLPAMEKVIEDNFTYLVTPTGQFIGPGPQDASTLFEREIIEKMTDPYTDKKGYLVLKINTIEHMTKAGFGAYFLPFIVMNFPLSVTTTDIEIKIEVLNSNKRLIGSYSGNSKNKMTARLYENNYRAADMARTSYVTALKEALEIAKGTMQADLARLNGLLQ